MRLISSHHFLLYILAIISLVKSSLSQGLNRNNYNFYDRMLKKKKTECEVTTCGHIIPDEAYNCVNKCMSETCYNQIYAPMPLEDGEIDTKRGKLFVTCIKTEVRKK